MSDDLTIGIRLTADGSAMVGTIKIGREEIDKLTAATGKATSETEKFSRSQSSLSSQLRSMAGELAGYWAAWKIGESIKDMALLNARYETLGISMSVVGKNAGYTASQMEAAALGMQQTGISMVESRQQAMRLVQAHIDLADSQKLARIAQDAAVIGNINSSEAFATMIHGIQSGQTDVLRNIGLNISMEQSYKIMADTLHKHADQLSQNEKTQAVLNSVMKAGQDIAGTYEAAMGTAGKQLNSMVRYSEDLKVKQGEVFNEFLTVAVMAYTEHLKDANGEISEMSRNGDLKKWGEDITDVMVGVANSINNIVVGVRIAAIEAAAIAEKGVLKSAAQGMLFGGAKSVLGMFGVDTSDHNTAKDDAIADEAKNFDKFSRALDERRAAKMEKETADTAAKRDHDLKATAEYYAKLSALDEKYFSGGMTAKKYEAEVANLANGDHHHYDDTAAGNGKNIESSIKKSDDFIKALRRESAELGMSTAQKKLYDAEQIASDMKKAGVRNSVITQFINLSEKESATLEVSKAKQKYLDDEFDRAVKQMDDMVKGYDAKQAAAVKVTESMQAELDKLIEQNDTYGMGTQALYDYRVAKMETALAEEKAKDATAQTTAELEKQLVIMRKMAEQGRRKDMFDAAKSAAEEWKKTNDEINRTLTDALMRAFESGKGFAEAFKKTVIDMFKTMILRPVISAVMSPVSGAVSGALGMSGTANAASSGSNLLNMASNASSLFNGGMSVMGDYAMGAMGIGSGLTQGAMLAAQTAEFGLAGATATAEALGGMASAAGGLTSALAAIPGWGWAALGAIAIGSSLGLFGGGGGPKQSEFKYGDVAALGSHNTATATTPGFYASNVSEQGDTYVDNAMAAYQKHLNETYSLQALKKASGVSFDLGPNPGIEAEINKFKSEVEPIIAAYDAALKSLSSAMTSLGKSLPIEQVDGLVQAFARAGVSADAMSTYYQNFYTDAERQADGLKKVVSDAMTALGVAIPTTIQGFRALVDAQDLSTAAGQDMFAGLMKISGAVAAVAAEEKHLNDQRRSMDISLMKLTGDAAGALAAQRADALAALDASLRPLQEQINAQTDLTAAYDKASSAMKAMQLLTTDSFATLVDYTRYMRLASNAGISSADAGLPPSPATTFMPGNSTGDNANKELVTSVDALRADLKAGQIAMAQYMAETAKILRRWNGDGMPEVRVLT